MCPQAHVYMCASACVCMYVCMCGFCPCLSHNLIDDDNIKPHISQVTYSRNFSTCQLYYCSVGQVYWPCPGMSNCIMWVEDCVRLAMWLALVHGDSKSKPAWLKRFCVHVQGGLGLPGREKTHCLKKVSEKKWPFLRRAKPIKNCRIRAEWAVFYQIS